MLANTRRQIGRKPDTALLYHAPPLPALSQTLVLHSRGAFANPTLAQQDRIPTTPSGTPPRPRTRAARTLQRTAGGAEASVTMWSSYPLMDISPATGIPRPGRPPCPSGTPSPGGPSSTRWAARDPVPGFTSTSSSGSAGRGEPTLPGATRSTNTAQGTGYRSSRTAARGVGLDMLGLLSLVPCRRRY